MSTWLPGSGSYSAKVILGTLCGEIGPIRVGIMSISYAIIKYHIWRSNSKDRKLLRKTVFKQFSEAISNHDVVIHPYAISGSLGLAITVDIGVKYGFL